MTHRYFSVVLLIDRETSKFQFLIVARILTFLNKMDRSQVSEYEARGKVTPRGRSIDTDVRCKLVGGLVTVF